MGSGRVNAIKNQFESLDRLDFLNVNVPKKILLTKTGIVERSKTTHDLFSKPESFITPGKVNSTTLIEDVKSVNEVFLAKERYTKLFNESKESKLLRQTSDPIKRSSIKRSPAFRISKNNTNASNNESTSQNPSACNYKNITKNPSNINSKARTTASIEKERNIIIAKEFDKRFEYFLVKKCSSGIERLQQSSLTDSIRYALRQPLPTGPPPKKPPRTFTFSNDGAETTINQQQQDNTNVIEMNEMQLLEHSFFFRNKQNNEINTIKLKKPGSLTKAKTELVLNGSKFLDYLSFRKSISTFYDPFLQTKYELSKQTEDNITASNVMKRFSKKVTSIEPLYMEPFGHLNVETNNLFRKFDNKIKTTSSTFKGDSISGLQVNERTCSCPELHHNFREDLHYLCIAIDDNMDNNLESSEVGTTYNEFTMIFDAAYQNKTNTSNDGYQKENSNENILASRLSRTLTEKRKDYVRKIAVLPEKKNKSYGNINGTFQSSIIKSFFLREIDRNLNNNNQQNKTENYKLNIDSNKQKVMQFANGLKNYKKLVEGNIENCVSIIESQIKKTTDLKTNISDKNESYSKIAIKNDGKINCIDCSKCNNINFDKVVDKVYEAVYIKDNDLNSSENEENEKLFEVFILVGYNFSEKRAYLKYKYPQHVNIPENIEQLVFPSDKLIYSDKVNQEYCLILTDDNGFKIYGYCRRILPEDCDTCLPLCYCIISETKAIAFYQKLLKEIESRHGQSDLQLNLMLESLQKSELPKAGKYLHIKLSLSNCLKADFQSHPKISPKHLSLETYPKRLTESIKNFVPKTEYNEQQFGNSKEHSEFSEEQFYDYKINNRQKSFLKKCEKKKGNHSSDTGLFDEGFLKQDPKCDEIFIRRPNDLRLENTELNDLYISLGPELLVTVFSTLLLERKVIFESENVTNLSKSILALQTILYPFQWQYTIVTVLPNSLTEVCQAPFPILVGSLESISFEIEDGIIINLDNKCIKQNCGDEHTILPDTLRESLQMSLEMVDLIDQDKKLSSVLISEAFLRFFVELFGNYKKKYFHKEEFIQCHTSQNIRFFLEWFVETSMFRHFCKHKFKKKAENITRTNTSNINDSMDYNEITTNKKYFDLFEARLIEKSENKSKTKQNIESIVKNSKIINKKGQSFKEKLKLFMGHHSCKSTN